MVGYEILTRGALIFVDSSFFIAVANDKDEWYTKAKEIAKTLQEEKPELRYTTLFDSNFDKVKGVARIGK